MTEAQLRTDGERPAVRLERELVDPPPVVWQALTDREQLRAWFPCDVQVTGGVWRVGATIGFDFGDGSGLLLDGEVLAVDEPKLLAFSWGDERLRFELAPHGSGTHLVLVNELAPDAAARNAAGWDACLDQLAGLEPGDWKPRFEAYSAVFEPLIGPQSGPPTA
ncbi:SRPBCC domain-containing protein [Nocardia vulneris]|uniref:ATPase n=1 Tax=Nocardia vulneris TaxID=1141657 RepID=A0ABR4ZLQ2_9NOCA|nr:SRPBCC domain-containing protein [Nocardia vulneris]KIA66318.1 ATPase [Nocardia vulneris]